MKTGIELITEERNRQIEVEGWDKEHDIIANNDEQMALAAVTYALPESYREYEYQVKNIWPWDIKWWKPSPKDRIRELVKAGALIAAEIDRISTMEE